MATEVKVPAVGESITSANVATWHKQHGDAVEAGEVLVTLETDKVSNEVEAPVAGRLEILVAEGEEVEIGTVIARVDESAAGDAGDGAEDGGGEEDGDGEENADDAKAEESGDAPEPAGGSDVGGESASEGEVVQVKVPAAGESITTANVAAWRKGSGDYIEKGEVLVTLETDKVSTEIEAEVSGTVKRLVSEGEEVEIGTIIAEITTGSAPAGSGKKKEDKEDAEASPKPAKKAPAGKPSPSETKDAGPSRDDAAAAKPDFQVVSSPAEKPDTTPVEDGRTTRRKMSMLRRKIASHLVSAQQTAAILSTFNEADMSAVMGLRKSVQEDFVAKHGVKLGFMSFFVKAVVQALKDVPQVNAMIEGNEIIENHFYDIGVAIGTEKGLVVPVLRDCDKKSFADIEQDILDYAAKAKEGKIGIEDLQGGVFTISNGGTYGSLLSTPILNPPQSGILGMHTIQQRPVAVDGEVVIRPMMYLAMSYDHRLVDGKEAVTFLIRVKDSIENPTRLMLEM